MNGKISSFQISHLTRDKSFKMSSHHYHNRYELYYLLAGENIFFIKDRTYLIKKGGLVLIDSNDLHRTSATGQAEHERILIEFNGNFLSDHLNSLNDLNPFSCFKQKSNLIELNIEEQTWIEDLLFTILKENKEKKSGYYTYIKLLLLQLLIFLSRSTKQLNREIEYPDELHSRISDIARFINISYNQNITLEFLSKKFSISPYYLSRTFKEVTGFSFIEFLNNVRIKEAQRLLRKTKLTITEISQKSGYNSLTHFGRMFKNNTGLSPLKYRNLKK